MFRVNNEDTDNANRIVVFFFVDFNVVDFEHVMLARLRFRNQSN